MFDVIIIGSGPAGVSASLYTTRANLKTLIIGNNKSSLNKADKIENYYGFESPVSGAYLLSEGQKQTQRLGTTVIEEDVVAISQNYDSAVPSFIVSTSLDKYESKAVLISSGQPVVKINIKGVQNLEGKGISYCSTCDGFFYRNKKIGVLGNMDFAVHEAMELVNFSKDITIYTNGLDLDLSDAFKDTVSSFKINKSHILQFNGEDTLQSITFKDGSSEDIDGMFIALGSASAVSFAKKLGLETDNNSIISNNKQETNIPGIYAAGDCTGGFKQIATAVGQGALAGRSIIEYVKKVWGAK